MLQNSWHASTQRGGIVILVCLMLMTLLSVTAFTLSRNVIRETAITGNVFQAGRSEAASNAGIDWFLAWSGEVALQGGPRTTTPRVTALQNSLEAVAGNPELDQGPSSWTATIAAGDEMVLGSQAGRPTQAFDLKLDLLGPAGSELRDGTLSASSVKNQNRRAEQTYGWELLSNGQALVHYDDSKYWRFQAPRACKLEIRPKEMQIVN